MKKWVKFVVYYKDGSTEEWTPEELEKVKALATDLIEMIMRSADKENYTHG